MAGCTDVGLWVNKMHMDFAQVLDLTRVRELRRVERYRHHVAIGAAVMALSTSAAMAAGQADFKAAPASSDPGFDAADHTGGARAVLAMQADAALLSSIEDEHELQALRPATRCEAGQRWEWDGVRFEVLHPLAADYGTGLRANALSCVLRVDNGRHSALLVGDIEAAQETRLVEAQALLKADLLLMPHHGSKTSSTPAFLDAVQPRIALAQAGYRNRFGHPAPAVLARYRERGIEVVESARCGAATWTSARPQAVSCQRETARRYWHHVVP